MLLTHIMLQPLWPGKLSAPSQSQGIIKEKTLFNTHLRPEYPQHKLNYLSIYLFIYFKGWGLQLGVNTTAPVTLIHTLRR